ncbi:MAG: hypothetical protein ACYCQI_10505 [Gammaproteobacteria bacterium]
MFMRCKQDASMSSEWKHICEGAEIKFRTRDTRKILASAYAKLSHYLYHKPDQNSLLISTRSVTNSQEFAKKAMYEIDSLRVKMMDDRTVKENVRDCFELLEKLHQLYQEQATKTRLVSVFVDTLFIKMIGTHPKNLTKDELRKMKLDIFSKLKIPLEKEAASKMPSITP